MHLCILKVSPTANFLEYLQNWPIWDRMSVAWGSTQTSAKLQGKRQLCVCDASIFHWGSLWCGTKAAYKFTRIPRLLGGTLARHFARSLVWGQSWSSRAAEFFWIQSYVQRCAVVNRIFLNIRCLFKGDLIRFVVPSCQEESVQGNGTRVSHFSTFR